MTRILAALALAFMAALASPAMAMSRIDLPAGYAPSGDYIAAALLGVGVAVAFMLATYRARSRSAARTCVCAALAMMAMSGACLADPACDAQFLDGKRPVLTHPVAGRLELCKSAYVVEWSPDTREPIYAAEHMVKDGLDKAKRVERTGSFHVEPAVPRGLRVTNDDYGDGYDKGHMAAEHDMPSAEAAHESFSYANAVPQDPTLNRGRWAHGEATVRALGLAAGEVWVVTGPIFDAHPKVTGETQIPVPSRLFKAVYVPAVAGKSSLVGAWIADNTADGKLEPVSLDALKAAAGLDPFPSLSPADHARVDFPAVAGK